MKIRKIKKRSKILIKAKLIAEEVEMNREEYSKLSIADLKIRTDYLIQGLQENKFSLDDIVVDAFSIAREIIFRVYNMLAYPVQIMGAYVAHTGDFAEMYTGEGKTVTIMLVAFLNALAKRGVHIVTVNEYLVQRDAELTQKAFEQLGITVGYNTSELSKEVKKEMFSRDITYTSNSELGFDYLRDNMVRSMDEKVIRELYFVIVDEGDSVLIDEARTPLIISGMPKEDYSLYLDVDKIVSSLQPEDYFIDLETNTISLTESGTDKVEKFFNLRNLYSVESSEIVHKVTNALVAHYVFANGREYIVKDNKIYLVDQFTGRVLEGRSYNAGLQQAIQAKERVQIEPENVVMATITYQSFFRLYKRLSAFSGTAMTEAEEFLKIYNMVVVRIPTNKPIIRIDKPDYIFGTKEIKWNHVIEEIANRHKTGQPVLVGTSSVTDSEIIHQRLQELKIPHTVLNARDNSKEADIVKLAGQVGAITISTNMAGRGTDIKVAEEAKKLGGLYVIGTERHESRRIDNQLRGRTGRQGDPGESRFFTSLEDSIFKRFATDKYEKASQKLEDEYHDWTFFTSFLNRTQKKIEGLNFDVRKNLMDYDHVLSLQRELVYKQRDQILLETQNKTIIKNMCNEYTTDLAYEYRNKENTAIVDSEQLVDIVNNKFLKFDYFTKEDFDGLSISDAKSFLDNIFDIIISTKMNILESINANNVIGEILLVNLDQKWTTHIDKMTKLREGVNLRSLEQRSPLNIYIEDGNNLFEKMKSDVVRDVIDGICNLNLPNESNEIRENLDKEQIKEVSKKKINQKANKHKSQANQESDNNAKENDLIADIQEKIDQTIEAQQQELEKEKEQEVQEEQKSDLEQIPVFKRIIDLTRNNDEEEQENKENSDETDEDYYESEEEYLKELENEIQITEIPEQYKDAQPDDLVPNYLIGKKGPVIKLEESKQPYIKEIKLEKEVNPDEEMFYSDFSSTYTQENYINLLNQKINYDKEEPKQEKKEDKKEWSIKNNEEEKQEKTYKIDDIFKTTNNVKEEPNNNEYHKIEDTIPNIVSENEKQTLMSDKYLSLDEFVKQKVKDNNSKKTEPKKISFSTDETKDLEPHELFDKNKLFNLDDNQDSLKDISLWDNEKERLMNIVNKENGVTENNNPFDSDVFDELLKFDNSNEDVLTPKMDQFPSFEDYKKYENLDYEYQYNDEIYKTPSNEFYDNPVAYGPTLARNIQSPADISKENMKKNAETDKYDVETFLNSFKFKKRNTNDSDLEKFKINANDSKNKENK